MIQMVYYLLNVKLTNTWEEAEEEKKEESALIHGIPGCLTVVNLTCYMPIHAVPSGIRW
jgi:threonine/homoserine efflux transporter RhtA